MSRNSTKPHGESHTIGELAALSGVRVETIRYFERIGLLTPPERTTGGHRLFSAADLARLNFVRRAREIGFSQREVRTLLSLSSGELTSCDEVKTLAENHLAVIRGKIRDLQRLDQLLSSTIAQCTGGKVPKCPVIEAIAHG
ncbi:MerR family transcriptional regulator [Taklimakanibacter deserti]|uniref:MerR family transcriptional regulator n=1 Tax=Taklimakanibacter deserti TaxID=2267839 RepID=UPI000E655E40